MSDVALQTDAITRQSLEWGGQLNRASHNASLFSLYLAMQLQPGNNPVTVAADEQPASDISAQLNKLNHYRRAATCATDDTYTTLTHYSRMAESNDGASLMLWRAMHPDPLSYKDNARHIEPDILANCSYATQRRWQKQDDALCSEIQQDPTRLADVVEGSGSLLV